MPFIASPSSAMFVASLARSTDVPCIRPHPKHNCSYNANPLAEQAVKGWRSISGADLQFEPMSLLPALSATSEGEQGSDAAVSSPFSHEARIGGEEEPPPPSPLPPPPPPPPPPRRDSFSEGVEELHLALGAGDLLAAAAASRRLLRAARAASAKAAADLAASSGGGGAGPDEAAVRAEEIPSDAGRCEGGEETAAGDAALATAATAAEEAAEKRSAERRQRAEQARPDPDPPCLR